MLADILPLRSDQNIENKPAFDHQVVVFHHLGAYDYILTSFIGNVYKMTMSTSSMVVIPSIILLFYSND